MECRLGKRQPEPGSPFALLIFNHFRSSRLTIMAFRATPTTELSLRR